MTVYAVNRAALGVRCDHNGCPSLASCAEDHGGDELNVCPEHCQETHERVSSGAVVTHVHGGSSYWGRSTECSACFVGRLHADCRP